MMNFEILQTKDKKVMARDILTNLQNGWVFHGNMIAVPNLDPGNPVIYVQAMVLPPNQAGYPNKPDAEKTAEPPN